MGLGERAGSRQGSNRRKIRISGFREASDTRLIGWNEQGAQYGGTRARAKSGLRVRIKDPGRKGGDGARNRGLRAGKSRAAILRPGRDRAASRVLLLRRQIPR